MGEYVLGTHDVELQRLGVQHRIWGAQAHAAWERGKLGPGSKVLDVGCGPGWALLDMAEIVGPAGVAVGIDESERYIETLKARAEARGLGQLHARCADIHDLQAVAADFGPFDMVYVRWVLCFVRDPGAVVRAMAQCLRPGGRLVIHDYFNYACMTIAPRDPRFSAGIAAIARSWVDHGGSPDVMEWSLKFAHDAGLVVRHLDVMQRIARPTDPAWAWPDLFWKSFIPRLVESGHLSSEQQREFFEAWHEASESPIAFMHLPPVYELVAERPAP